MRYRIYKNFSFYNDFIQSIKAIGTVFNLDLRSAKLICDDMRNESIPYITKELSYEQISLLEINNFVVEEIIDNHLPNDLFSIDKDNDIEIRTIEFHNNKLSIISNLMAFSVKLTNIQKEKLRKDLENDTN